MNERTLFLAFACLALAACARPEGGQHPIGGHGQGEAEHGGHHADEEGHGHGHGEGNLSLTLFSAGHELFVEIEPLAAGKESVYTAHVTRLKDNHPALEGTLTVRFEQNGTTASETTAEAPSRRGIFEFPAPSPAGTGTYWMEFEYAGHGDRAVWRSQQEVPKEPHPAEEEGGEDLSFTKEQQWNIPFGQEQAVTRSLGRTFTVPGTIVEDPISSRAIVAPATGHFHWNEVFRGGGIGTEVKGGQELATLRPDVPVEHWSQLEESIVLAEIEVKRTTEELDRVQRLVEGGLLPAKDLLAVDAAIKKAGIEERKARKVRNRTRKLVDEGLLPERRLADVEAAAAKARVEREGFEAERKRLQDLGESRILQEEGLIEARAAVHRALAGYEAAQARLREKKGEVERMIPILAPMDGVLTEILTPHGHQVSLGAPVAHVVSDKTVLLQVEVSMFDLKGLDDIAEIWLWVPGSDSSRKLSEFNARRVTDRLVYDPDRLTATISYRLENPGRFRIGEYVEVQIMHSPGEKLPVVRRSAIVEINTVPYVFVALSGEGYARRRVVPGTRVGEFVAIKEGVEAGEWVVTRGGFDLYVTSLTGTLQSHQH